MQNGNQRGSPRGSWEMREGSGGRRVVLMGKTWKNEAGREGREMGRVAGGTALSGGEPGSWPSDSSCLELILGFSEDVHLITLK